MRASRLLRILMLLQMRGRMSAEALAEEFEVSARTIHRDIDQLSAAGVPVYAERGRSGGFALMDGYRTRLTGFTAQEAETLLLAGVGKAAADLGLGPELAAAQLKLLAALPADSGAGAQRVAQRFHLDPAPWYGRPEPIDLLPQIASAVWTDRRARITYESWKAVVTRDIDPLGLVLKAGAWYLVASVKGGPRSYRVSYIRSFDLLPGASRRPSRFSLPRWWTRSAKEFEASLLRDRAEVKLSPEGLRRLRESSPAAAQAVDALHRKLPDGWLRAEIPVEAGDYTVRQLLQVGPEIEVISPPELRAALHAAASEIAGWHAPKRNRHVSSSTSQ